MRGDGPSPDDAAWRGSFERVREQPPQDYYPRARIRLTIRLEEFGDEDTPDSPQMPPHFRKGKGIDPAIDHMTVNQDSTTGAWFVGSAATPSGGTPQSPVSSSDGRTFKIEGIAPTHLGVMKNGTRQADTCTITMRYLDFPLDPRAVRSMAVEAYIGTVQADQYAREMAGQNDSTSPGVLNSIPDTYVDRFGRPRSNLRFQGFADEIDVEFDEDGEPLITIECTDNTSILLNADAPPKLSISPTQPIDKAIADYLANFPQFAGLQVQYQPVGSPVPKLSVALAKTAFKPKLGPPPAGGAGGGGGGQTKFAVFDYLTDVVGSLGLIMRVVGTTIVVQRPRTLYATKFSGRPDDPFTGRILPSGRVVTNRLFIHGRNILKQNFKRSLRQPSTHNNIEIRCYSGRKGQTLVGRFPLVSNTPPRGKKGKRKGPHGKVGGALVGRQKKIHPGDKADELWKVITVSGIEDEATLRAIAQSVYEQVSRNELCLRFQTISPASYGGDNGDPDVLDMEAGDPIDVEVARASPTDADSANSVGVTEDALASRPSAFLQSLGFDPAFADAYAACIGNVGLSSTYRVRTVSFDFTDDADASGGGNDDSLVIDIEAVNFIEIRQSAELAAGEEIEPPAPSNGGPVQVTVVQDDASGSSGSPWI